MRIAAVLLLFFCIFEAAGAQPLVTEEGANLTGQLLVATPELDNSSFAETVIYMIEHNENGAMGLVINRPMAKGPIADLLKGLGAESEGAKGEIIIHVGGPVEPGKAFVLHSDDYTDEGTKSLRDGLAVTTDAKVVRALGSGKGPGQSIFVLGYAGWAPGQLEAEIKAGGWFSIPADKKIIFGGDPKTKWKSAVDRQKVKT